MIDPDSMQQGGSHGFTSLPVIAGIIKLVRMDNPWLIKTAGLMVLPFLTLAASTYMQVDRDTRNIDILQKQMVNEQKKSESIQMMVAVMVSQLPPPKAGAPTALDVIEVMQKVQNP